MMRSFRIIAIALLVWNLIGIAAYISQVTADLDSLAKTDPVTADAFRAMPQWAWASYAVAVFVGTGAAIALLLRRRIAWVLFAISLAAIIVQFGWTFAGYDLIARKGISTTIFPLVLIAIALAATLYARRKSADRTLR